METATPPRVVVLHQAVPPGAPPDEQDVLHEAAAVATALSELGWLPVALPFTLDLEAMRTELRRLAPVFVWNLVESAGGTGRLIHLAPALLDSLGIPFTGAPTDAVYLTSNKLLTKRLLRLSGIPTPSWTHGAALHRPEPPGPPPYIVKSVWEHGSVGIGDDAVVHDPARLPEVARRLAPLMGGEVFAEAFIPGREFNLSLLAGRVLPPAEIRFESFPEGRPRIVGYRAKWADESVECRTTVRHFDFPPSDRPLLDELAGIAKACWDAFELSGAARVDFRVDPAGRPWVLEVNANPGMAPDAGFTAAVLNAGFSFAGMVRAVVENRRPGPTG